MPARALATMLLIAGTFASNMPPPPQDGGGGGTGPATGGTGSTSSSACTLADNSFCGTAGTNNQVTLNLSYNTTSGKFSGTIVTNQCPNHPTYNQAKVSCEQQTFPDPSYANGPNGAPLLGRLGLSLYGVNIYGPFEAGFQEGFACDGGDCAAGIDVSTCEAELEYECTSNLTTTLFPDTCGGHADPYHYHNDLACDYNPSDSSVHSPLIGVALDGYGIYGKWESNGQRPCDLDYCRGHAATVPANATFGIAAGTVYHYHTYDGSEYPGLRTVGCFGPADTLTACKALYSECDDGDVITVVTNDYPDGLTVDTYCPCFQATVPGCATPVYTPTLTPTTTPTATPTPTSTVGSTTDSASAVSVFAVLVASLLGALLL